MKAIALFALLLSASAGAQTSAQFNRCQSTGEAAEGVTGAMVACANAETERQDKRLNSHYQALMARQSASGKIRLREDERKWLRQRKRVCLEQRNATGGTIDLINYASCMMDETEHRATRLKSWLDAGKQF